MKHNLSKVVKSKPPQSQPSIQIVDVDLSTLIESTPSKTPSSKIPSSKSTVPGSSQPSTNIIENEDLAWERFQMAVLDEDINICYNMGLKEFQHSGVHDFFKVCSCSFIVLVHLTIFLRLIILYFLLIYRPCQSLWRHPDRQQNWTRRGSCWRQGFKK